MLSRLSSRKFLLTVATVTFFLLLHDYENAKQLVIAFLAVEGGADIVQRYRGGGVTAYSDENPTSQNASHDGFVTGAGTVRSTLDEDDDSK